ncbi:MAG TPA: hypothetical protein VFF31_28960 [Blastocatellia bacterium]|nr:hypothetical protein [Blastocatellia bacterium]
MKERKNETANSETLNPQADTLVDLAIADEQADETKGGTSDYNTWRNRFGTTL